VISDVKEVLMLLNDDVRSLIYGHRVKDYKKPKKEKDTKKCYKCK